MKKSHFAFTISEVLITLGIIGLIAVIWLPTALTNISDRVFERSKQVALKKISDAVNQLNVNRTFDVEETNVEFADKLSGIMKVAIRCSASDLSGCFSSRIYTGSGDEILTNSLTTGDDLGPNNNSDPTAGLLLVDGTSMLIALREPTGLSDSCIQIKPFDDATSCVSIMYDVNGPQNPNRIGKDIALMNATISICDGLRFAGICVDANNTTYSYIDTCDGSTDIAYDTRGSSNTYCAENAWAGAKKACDLQGKRLFTMSELYTLAQAMGTNPSVYALNLNGTHYTSEEWTATIAKGIYIASWASIYNNQSYIKNLMTTTVRCVK